VLPPPALQVDFTGAPLVRSPRHSLNASITFSRDIGPGQLQVTAEENYSSSYTNDYQGAPPTATTAQVLALYRTPSYGITNLSASYDWGSWQLSAYARNLTNRETIVAVLGFDAVNYPQEVPGEPRTIGAAFKFSF
jgi:outer membrane receptor protein involved in Fe transport